MAEIRITDVNMVAWFGNDNVNTKRFKLYRIIGIIGMYILKIKT